MTQPRTIVTLAGRLDHARPWRDVTPEEKSSYLRDVLAASDKRQEADRIINDHLSLSTPDHPNRSHWWRLATLLRVHADQQDALADGRRWRLNDESAKRWTGGIPAGDETEHLHRCAYLCAQFPRRSGRTGVPPVQLDAGRPGQPSYEIDVAVDMGQMALDVQPWLLREGDALVAWHRQNLPPVCPGELGDGVHLPEPIYGWRGITWSLAWWLEMETAAGTALRPLAERLAIAVKADRDDGEFFRTPGQRHLWRRMVGCSVDLWEQRTGLSTGVPHGCYVILTSPQARSRLAKPRTAPPTTPAPAAPTADS